MPRSDASSQETNALSRAEAEVERTKQRVALSVMALRDEVSRQSDWRWWVARRPVACLCGAFAVGLWFGHRR
jgi:hypothetical protein